MRWGSSVFITPSTTSGGPPPHAIAWGGIPPRLSGTPPFIADAIGGELCPFQHPSGSPPTEESGASPHLSDIPLLYERRSTLRQQGEVIVKCPKLPVCLYFFQSFIITLFYYNHTS